MLYANQAAPTSQPLQKEGRRPSGRTETVRVLLVEDEPVTSQVFARALQKSGHTVRIAADGNQALHALRDESPDVLVVSGAPMRALKSGADLVEPGEWIEKPVRPAELVAAVERLLASR